jgi:hypothetical protein
MKLYILVRIFFSFRVEQPNWDKKGLLGRLFKSQFGKY